MQSRSEMRESTIAVLKWLLNGLETGKIDAVGLNFNFTNMSDYVDGSVTVSRPQSTTVTFEIVKNGGER